MSYLRTLIDRLEKRGYMYYVCDMVIRYGKERFSEEMECDYKKEIGGEIDYEKGFEKILKRIEP